FFFLIILLHPNFTFFPYTTLFRSTQSGMILLLLLSLFLTIIAGKIILLVFKMHSYRKKLLAQTISNSTCHVLLKKLAIEEKTFLDRKSTRLNSSHVAISYAVFCLK